MNSRLWNTLGELLTQKSEALEDIADKMERPDYKARYKERSETMSDLADVFKMMAQEVRKIE